MTTWLGSRTQCPHPPAGPRFSRGFLTIPADGTPSPIHFLTGRRRTLSSLLCACGAGPTLGASQGRLLVLFSSFSPLTFSDTS